ncbi:hypothetical protein KIH39_11335 [Telmatocola sphagniphila]|uniref:Uncharacterized protein n=1 Tax=Telmatocola sphagniphila TaxID=1123043 RepID=A0A8E6BAK9_9BACT|nr:hypothetical protein [Telmatocola sphagniphila]QVL34469.1 hypothetical protein KIH39_11335 [Telmatocola sphagniphila]
MKKLSLALLLLCGPAGLAFAQDGVRPPATTASGYYQTRWSAPNGSPVAEPRILPTVTPEKTDPVISPPLAARFDAPKVVAKPTEVDSTPSKHWLTPDGNPPPAIGVTAVATSSKAPGLKASLGNVVSPYNPQPPVSLNPPTSLAATPSAVPPATLITPVSLKTVTTASPPAQLPASLTANASLATPTPIATAPKAWLGNPTPVKVVIADNQKQLAGLGISQADGK